MSGNFGGNSLPTTPITGGNITKSEYSGFTCTKIIGDSSSNGTFTYKGVSIPVAAGSTVDMLVNPSGVTFPLASLVFLCYDCSCENPVTSPVTPSTDNYNNYGPNNKPIIIGGGGLNS